MQERIGGDPDLTVRGHRYAKALGQYINALGEGEIYGGVHIHVNPVDLYYGVWGRDVLVTDTIRHIGDKTYWRQKQNQTYW